MLHEFNPDSIVDVDLTPHDKLQLIYGQLRYMGEVHCKLHDNYIDLRGHTIESVDEYIWIDHMYKSKFTIDHFTAMVGDIWRLCK